MDYKRKKISDGEYINTICTDKFKTAVFTVKFILPLSEKTASYYALIPNVLKCGTAELPTIREISRRLQELYGMELFSSSVKVGDYQSVSFSIAMLDSKYSMGDGGNITEQAISLLSSVMFSPYTENGVFSPAYVEREKKTLIDSIRATRNNKNSFAVEKCVEHMFAGDPFSVNPKGCEKIIAGIDPKTLFSYYEKFLSEARIEAFYIGAEPHEKIEKIFAEKFHFSERNYSALPEVRRKAAVKVNEAQEDAAATQGKMVMGFDLGCTSYDAMCDAAPLFMAVFSMSPVSKLFLNVREKLSLCYYCQGVPEYLKGVLIVSSGIDNTNFEAAKSEILRQLDAVKSGDITDEEMFFAKKSLNDIYRTINDSPFSIENWCFNRVISGKFYTPEEKADDIMKMDAGKVSEFARGIKLDTVFFLRGAGTSGLEEEKDEA